MGIVGNLERGSGVGPTGGCVEIGTHRGLHHTDPGFGVVAAHRCRRQLRGDEEQVRPLMDPHPVGERVRHEHHGGQVGPLVLEVDGGGCPGGKDRYDQVGGVAINLFDEFGQHDLDRSPIHEPAQRPVPPELREVEAVVHGGH